MTNAEENKKLHTGHRARMRKKLIEFGPERFDDHEILEMLLYHAIPRGDTNPAAHRLFDQFKSFRGILEATPEELMGVEGIGESSAALFALIREIARRYHTARIAKRLQLHSTQALGAFIAPLFIGRREEHVYLLCLDAQKTPLYGKFIHTGSLAAAALDIPKILSVAVNVRAKYVVFAHNHPSGFAVPSESDLSATLRLKRALDEVGITLLDHLIIADPTDPAEPAGDYISLADSHLF